LEKQINTTAVRATGLTQMQSPPEDFLDTAQRTNGNVHPNRELRDANRHMHEFLAVLGHELRSPLAAMRNALHMLEQKGDDASVRERYVRMMQRQTQSIGRLIDELLEVSRIEHGKIQLRKLHMDLAQSVSRAVETALASIEERGHRLEVSVPREPVSLEADPGRLEQVLTNLLENAAKYMKPGGHIWLTAEVRSGNVVLRVRDTGIGIDPEALPHVFEPFWQNSHDHSQGGLGIGLALVRKLVEMHGGVVSASSPGLNCGSEFVVCFPAHAEFMEH
jgi:signal transduction histidine kinase